MNLFKNYIIGNLMNVRKTSLLNFMPVHNWKLHGSEVLAVKILLYLIFYFINCTRSLVLQLEFEVIYYTFPNQ